MSRPMRIEFPGAVYHITSRGNEKKKIFLNDRDREVFLDIVQQVKDRFHWRFHSYVLMDNHYHLLIETPEANLSRGMRQLNGVYTREFNRWHARVGHLFQGRFKAILIEKDDYLVEVSRYIALNPVRANIVDKAQDWPWSSYCATIGIDKPPAWLTVGWILEQYGADRKTAAACYKRYVEKGIGGEYPADELRGGWILGSERFLAKIQGLIEEKNEVIEMPRPQRLAPRKELDEIFQQDARLGASRGESIYRSYVDAGYTMKEIADYLGVHYVSVSRAIKKYENEK
ncbi:MAG: transposase [Acidobacteria bacterium]|nr:transposase [Acidobacteriota bacterium]